MSTAHAPRPGGRTARTTANVYGAVRALVNEPEAERSFPVIAAMAGVHVATLYRRWKTPKALILAALVADLEDTAAIDVTGDLRADLTQYADQLAAATSSPAGLTLLRALIDATADPAMDDAHVRQLVQPRLGAFQSILDAAGITTLTSLDIVNYLLAPLYLRALLSAPFQPGSSDLQRLVEHLVALSETEPPCA